MTLQPKAQRRRCVKTASNRLLRLVLALVFTASRRRLCCQAWAPLSSRSKTTRILNNLQKATSSTFFAASLLGGALFFPFDGAFATDDSALTNGLSMPTPDTPQIMFSGNRPNQGPTLRTAQGPQILPQKQKAGKSPILQGLVYIDRPNSRPSFADTLVLTLGTADRSEEVLAGAKIPITQARFPMQFSMYKENIVRGKEEQFSKAMNGDVFVTARVCPEDVTKLPCSDAEATYQARGVSKLLSNLPGMDDDTSVRTSVSLPLK